MGRNFGLPAELLSYPPNPFTLDEALSFTLLHDVVVRPGSVSVELQQMSEIWRAMSDFGVDAAEYLPYWRNADVAQTSAPDIRTSIYRRPESGLLFVVSNLGAADAPAATVQLDLKALLPAGSTGVATDALTGESLRFEDGRITLSIPRLRMRLLHVR